MIIGMCMFALSMYTMISIIINYWYRVAQGAKASMDWPGTAFCYPSLSVYYHLSVYSINHRDVHVCYLNFYVCYDLYYHY